jgi:guanylate kinase
MKPTIVTLTGPSCAGKSTLERMLADSGMVSLMSTTTRKPRPGEIDGVHYNFITQEEFDAIRQRDGFIEHVTFGGNSYGLSVKAMAVATPENKPAVVVVEPAGRDQIVRFGKIHSWNIHTVFVDNPPEVIARRFLNRIAYDAYNAGRKYGEVGSIMDTYTSRLTTMMTVESKWRNDGFPYDLSISRFDATNEKEMVDRVWSLIKLDDCIKNAA